MVNSVVPVASVRGGKMAGRRKADGTGDGSARPGGAMAGPGGPEQVSQGMPGGAMRARPGSAGMPGAAMRGAPAQGGNGARAAAGGGMPGGGGMAGAGAGGQSPA